MLTFFLAKNIIQKEFQQFNPQQNIEVFFLTFFSYILFQMGAKVIPAITERGREKEKFVSTSSAIWLNVIRITTCSSLFGEKITCPLICFRDSFSASESFRACTTETHFAPDQRSTLTTYTRLYPAERVRGEGRDYYYYTFINSRAIICTSRGSCLWLYLFSIFPQSFFTAPSHLLYYSICGEREKVPLHHVKLMF